MRKQFIVGLLLMFAIQIFADVGSPPKFNLEKQGFSLSQMQTISPVAVVVPEYTFEKVFAGSPVLQPIYVAVLPAYTFVDKVLLVEDVVSWRVKNSGVQTNKLNLAGKQWNSPYSNYLRFYCSC